MTEPMPVISDLIAAFVAVVSIGILVNIYLFCSYRAESESETTATRTRWTQFSSETLGGPSYRQLALVSLLGLYLELLMIRWISSEIRIFAYFKNFVLVACFLGFGLGCYLCRRRVNLLPQMTIPLLTLALLVKLPWPGLRKLVSELPAFIGAISEVHIWMVPALPVGWFSLSILAAAVAVIVPIFCLIVFVFIPVGQLVGWYLENAANGIFGYSVNILGSLAGIILYTLLCFLYQPPATWFLLAGAMLVWLLWSRPGLRWASAAAFLVCVGLLSLSAPNRTVYWSPYQKLTLIPRDKAGEIIGYVLNTNDSWYQQILDLSPGFVASHPEFFDKVPIEWNAYNVPYHFYPQPPSALVLGAGMGNDVAAALRNGAGRVVAVEIDPVILKLGQERHFEKPYRSPRVQVVQDDARSYVQNTNDRFDLIVFSLLDSHTTTSHFTHIRIDNYVYTREALEATKQLLRPDGILIIKFQVDTPWIAGRLYGLLESIFGRPPVQLQTDDSAYTTEGRFFITGSMRRIAQALSDPQLAAYVAKHRDVKTERATLTTDDWPYFYQHAPGLPLPVIVISSVLVLLCWLFMRKTGTAISTFRWHFFFLGAGFLLLEAQIVSKMALLFGTTWMVNSIVIAGVLLLILASNILVEMHPRIPVSFGYAGVFASILLGYAIPLERFFFKSVFLKAITATVVLCLPVLFAGIVFIRSFARENFRGEALGSNLFGALIGGILESLSLWTGIRSLLAIAALLYLASWVALRLEEPLARTALGLPAREIHS